MEPMRPAPDDGRSEESAPRGHGERQDQQGRVCPQDGGPDAVPRASSEVVLVQHKLYEGLQGELALGLRCGSSQTSTATT